MTADSVAQYVRAAYRSTDTDRFLVEGFRSALLPDARLVPSRGPFARDRARVLHSASFRRLAGKTQVVAPDEDEVPRTRLTHSLEVAQIAREIGALLGCDPDLTELAGLAHDIGHPPFGHNGESALDRVAGPAGGFEANAQNLRLLTRLEGKVVGPDGRPLGLNLTRAALDAVIKYPWARPTAGGKFGVYPDDAQLFDWVRSAGPAAPLDRCLESQVMDWADDVAYSVHDVEDGVHADRVRLEALRDDAEREAVCAHAATQTSFSAADLEAVLVELLELAVVRDAIDAAGTSAGESALLRMTSELIGRFSTGAVAATRAVAGPGPLRRYDADLVVPSRLAAEVAVLKSIAHRYVMADPVRQELQTQQRILLTELVEALLDRGSEVLDPPFSGLFDRADGDNARLRVVIDQVALFTDRQAIARHRRLLGPDRSLV